MRSCCCPYAKRSVAIFLAGVAAICVFGVFEALRPTVAAEGGGVEPMSVTPLIQMFMLTAAAMILLLAHVQATDVASTAIFKSGMVAMIALFGIAWMADTFIANNEDAIVAALGGLAENWPFTIAIAIFLVAALTTSQSAATRTMIPLGLALGIGAGYMIAMWTAVAGGALPAGERNPDRGRRGRRDGHDHAGQARDRPLLPGSTPGLLDHDAARGLRDRLPLLRRPHARSAGTDDADA